MSSQEWCRLFQPHDPTLLQQAVSTHRRLFLRTHGAAWMASLLPWAQVNGLIRLDALVSGKQMLVRRNRPLPLEMISAIPPLSSQRILYPDALQTLCNLGLSLVLNAVEEQVPAVAALTALVERHLGCRTVANAYASFRQDSAFDAHFDSHNVLILQLQGRKRWWCHGPVEEWPLTSRNLAPADLPPVEWEGVLAPGDLLFVPRGDVHRAQVEGENSLHLTVTMVPPTGLDVVGWLGRTAAANAPLLRQDIPAAGTPEMAAHAAALKAELHRQVEALDLERFLADADQQRGLVRHFTLGLDAGMKPGTVLVPMLRRRIPLPPAGPDGVTLIIEGGTFRLSAAERDLLAVLLEQDGLTLAALEARLPDHDLATAAAGLIRKSLALPQQSTDWL